MTSAHQPVVFRCDEVELLGIIEHADRPAATGVIIITGGPQYRAGSHRQFVDISRRLAAAGYPSMRFDYRGMGDSAGPETAFSETVPDLRAAIDVFIANTSVSGVVLWGLCDAASAAMIYAHQDDRVSGLVLLNPWVRTDEGLAQAYVKNYYLGRLLTRQFWRKLVSSEFAWRRSIRELAMNIKSTMRLLVRARRSGETVVGDKPSDDFRDRMRYGLEQFSGNTLFLLCGADLTASEFADYTKQAAGWNKVMARGTVEQVTLPGMDHTFSTSAWRDRIINETANWIAQTLVTTPS